MRSVKEIVSPWRGSTATEESMREQVRERYGDDEADAFSAATDAMPFAAWAAFKFRVKPGEKSFRTVTFVEVKNEAGEVIRTVPRTAHLFHRNQVERMP